MKVKKTSWHFKAWRWMQEANKPLPVPTVCGYWMAIFVGIPLTGLFLVVIGPLAWLSDKLESRFEGKSYCPFGKVEIEP